MRHKSLIIKDIIGACLVVAIFLMTVFLFVDPVPVVYWSTSKNECVRIEIKGEVFDCSDMPEKYERVWVK